MRNEGPPLEVLLRRLSEMPAEFLAEPRTRDSDGVRVEAVAWDSLRAFGGPPLTAEQLAKLKLAERPAAERNRLRLALAACWTWSDPWFRGRREMLGPAAQFLAVQIDHFAPDLDAERLMSDQDRREELARRVLAALGLNPLGESDAQADDRLATLDSSERRRVLQAAVEAEMRARAIRDAMAKKEAQESASRYGE